MQAKKNLRAEIRLKLESQDPQKRRSNSAKIKDKLFGLDVFKKAKNVCCYVSLPEEVDTRLIIEEALAMGKRVFVPLTNLENKELEIYAIENPVRDLQKGTLGIPEPRRDKARQGDPKDIDCVIVPGLVFDKTHRIGRGAGFYDRFLVKLKSGTPKIALAFSFQIVQQVPIEAHDVRMDYVLTDQ